MRGDHHQAVEIVHVAGEQWEHDEPFAAEELGERCDHREFQVVASCAVLATLRHSTPNVSSPVRRASAAAASPRRTSRRRTPGGPG